MMMRNRSPLLFALLLHCCAVVVVTARRSYFHEDPRYVSFGKWTVPAGGREDRRADAVSSRSMLMAIGGGRDGGDSIVSKDESSMTSGQDLVELCSASYADERSTNLLARLGKPRRRKQHHHGQRQAPTTSQIIQDESTQNDSTAAATAEQDESSMLQALIQPLIPQRVWDRLKGDEFQRFPDLLDGLSATGEKLARQDYSNESIDWKVHSKGGTSLEDGDVLVWVGTSLKEGYGSAVPWIKTRSIIPLAADEMVELLMDSSRVTTYNPWSLGRVDCWVNGEPDPLHPARQTKIVKNRVQPPMGAKAAVSVTMLHARPIAADGTWLVVSRATGGNRFPELDQDQVGKSDILLGVNLVQPIDDDSCLLTAVTHAYSAIMPAMLAERLGVKGAIKFVKDIRALRVSAN
jgi:hypothetical protein